MNTLGEFARIPMQVKARGVLASVFPGGAMVMTNAHAGDSEDMASIPGW